jgi:hypothetical protein
MVFRRLASIAAAAIVIGAPLQATAGPGNAPPASVSAPSVSGSAAVGSTLSASTGTWSGKGLKYSFAWQRCDGTGGSCAPSGGTASTYVLGSGDAGATFRAAVTATNKGGSATATSAATAPVTAPVASSPPPPAAPPPPPPPSADPSGEAMPTGDLPGWHQIFTDDFAQDVPLGGFPSAVSTKWKPYPFPWKDTSKNGTYWPEKGISEHGGMMDLWLHTETVNGVTYHISEAPQPILPIATRGQLYGRYVIRFKADPVPGYKTAWLLWPDSGLRTDGEIDFPEGNLNGTFYAYMHHQDATSGSDQDAYSTGATYTSWHTAVIEWLPTRCTFILDGRVIGNSTTRIPSTPMHWVIQTETQLSGGAPADSASGHVYIDWVAVYSRA